ncbi:MAG: hypothetical protein Q8O53_02585 [Candidatus Moranbacteria bacterium]|nr:hypothetical protein [Candidatus Moranbacteria bacterium]
MAEGELYAGGMQRFQREGYPTPRGVEFPSEGFEEKLEQLRAGDAAKIAVKKYKIVDVVKEFLKTHTTSDLDKVTCEKLLFSNNLEDNHPALVRAIAEELEIERLAKEAYKKTIH